MALLKDLTVYGASRFIGDVLSSQVYSDGFHHNAHNTNDYVLLAGGSAKALNTLATNDHNHNNSAAKTAWGQQYVNASGTLTTISGNMSSVGNIIPSGDNAQNIGSATNRWAKLYIGTADSYGSATKGIYWDAGVPKACTVAINSGTANKIAYYSSNNVISAATGKVGDTTKPIYLNDGVPTALSGSAGGSATPVYLNKGTITQLTETRGGNKQPVWLNGGEIVASGETEGSGTQFVYLSNGIITKTTSTVGSSTKPIYLNAGVITECSTMATSSHTHSIKLGGTIITVPAPGTTPTATTSITGPFAIDTSADSTKAFSIRRTDDSEAVKHWVDDGTYHIDYTNDEATSSIAIRIINTDTERASNKGADAKDITVYLDTYRQFYPSANNTGSIGTSSYKWKYIYGTTIYGDLTGNVTGNASSATKLATARNINGTSFNGTTDITTAKWGTARNISIADSDSTNTGTAVSVDGSAAVTLKLPSTIKATLTGNASTATKLATARNINGTSFDGSADITTANWGTARNISIADSDSTNTGTAVSVDGSAAVTLKLPSTIKATLTGNASTATKLANARTIWGQSFDGTANISGNMSSVGNISFSASGKNIGSILYFDTTNSRLGIGKSDPSHKLEVAGNISLYSTSGDSPYLYFQRGTTSDSYNDWRINCVGGNLNFNMSSNGTWSTTPLFQLSTTAGTAYLNGYTVYHSGNLTYSTLGIKQRIITIDGTEYTFYSPYDTNVTVATTKVTQNKVTDSSTYRLLFKYSANDTNETNTIKYASTLYYNPSTKLLTNSGGGATFESVVNITGTSDYCEGIRLHHVSGLSSIWYGATSETGYNAGMWGITVNSNGMRFRGPASTTATSVNDYMNILHGGNVGIGTTSPTEKLYVDGYVYATGFKTSTNSAEYCLTSNGGHKRWVANDKTASTIVARNSSGNIFVNCISTTAENIDSTDFAKVYVGTDNSNVIKYVTKDKFFKDINAYDTLTFTKTLKVTEAWMDTGITTGDANTANTINKGNGTYVVQISHGTLNNGTDSWPAIYSGIMSIYHSTNGSLTDEIILHRSGHAGGKRLYLRTLQTSSSSGYCKIQIAAESNFEANASLTFKFRKLI